MKRGLVSNRSFFSNVGKPARKPLRTFLEMCNELGMTKAQMIGLFSSRPDHPVAVMKHSNTRTEKNSWYDPDEFRAWFKRVKAEKVQP